MRVVECVAFMEMRKEYTILTGKSERMEPTERNIRRWMDNIKMSFK
jgi:hypothetical protein